MGKRKAGAAPRQPRTVDDGQTLTSKGNERIFGNACIGLVRRAWGLAAVWPFARPSQGTIEEHDGDRGRTPNQRGLARVWDYGSAMYQLRGTLREKDEARARLIDFFVKQRTTEGHQYAEANTTSHGQLWLLIGASAHALALNHGDHELLAHTGEWWRCKAALDDVLLDSDSYWTSPCGRSAGSTYDLGTVSAHLIRGTIPPKDSLIPNARGGVRPLIELGFFDKSYNIGARMMLQMIAAGDTLGGATNGERSPVVLRDPLHVYRRGDEYVKVSPYARSSEFLFWCARLNRRPSVECVETSPGRYEAPHRGGRFPQGLDNPFPAPSFAGDLTIIPGVP